MPKVLTEAEIEQFMELGWIKVEEAFSRADALACQDYLWERIKPRGVEKDDRSTWTQPMLWVQEAYRSPEFDKSNTQRLADAIEDLIGEGRWSENRV